MKNAATTEKNAETSAQALRGMVEVMRQLRAQMGDKAYFEYFAFDKAMARLRPIGQQEGK